MSRTDIKKAGVVLEAFCGAGTPAGESFGALDLVAHFHDSGLNPDEIKRESPMLNSTGGWIMAQGNPRS